MLEVALPNCERVRPRVLGPNRPLLEIPDNLTGPKPYFKISMNGIVERVKSQ